MKTETFLVLVSAKYSVREDLESWILLHKLDDLSDYVWDSKEHFLNKLRFDEKNTIPVEEVRFIPIYEFVDWWNDQDDDTEGFDKMNPTDSWMGYIQVKVQ